MWNRSFLILHGVENRRPAAHWQHDLALQLRERGEQVFYPQLPEPDRPKRADWIGAVEAELEMMRGERIVVCHGLGSATWLHVAVHLGHAPADRVLLVSPPGPSLFSWDGIAGFTTAGIDLSGLKVARSSVRLVGSKDDPYCPEGVDKVFGRPLGCEVDSLSGAGHLAIEDGYGPWPSALEWCLDPSTRLTPNH